VLGHGFERPEVPVSRRPAVWPESIPSEHAPLRKSFHFGTKVKLDATRACLALGDKQEQVMQDKLQANAQRPRGTRQQVSFRAFALRADGTSVDVSLRDLSYDGCLLSSEESFEVGERLRLLVRRRGAIDAQVCWLDGEKIGLRFAEGMAA
jgi:hypothetical protein